MALKSKLEESRQPALPKSRFLDILNRFSKSHILVIGDFILDEFVWGAVDRISPEAPVPVVRVNRQSFMPGGALNVANNARSLSGTVYPCGVVGRDLWGRMLVRTMRREKIETGGVVYDKTRPTTLKTRVIAHSQQVVRFDRENAAAINQADTKKILQFMEHAMARVGVAVIEDYGKGVISSALVKKVIQLAKARKIPVLVDPKEKNFDCYRGVTVMTPNKKEAYGAYGKFAGDEPPPLQTVGKALLKKFACQAVLITLGEEGMMLFEKNGGITKIPTAAREVYDVSGAGDTVISVLALALAAGASMREAAVIANAAAGVVVGKLGTATLTREELRAAMNGALR